MSLTRKLLKELQLNDDAIEQIIQAHVDTVDALKAEAEAARTAAQADHDLLMGQIAELSARETDAQRIRQEFDDYRAAQEAAAIAQSVQQAVMGALQEAGANEKALLLLSHEIDPASVQVENGRLTNADALIAPVKEKYAAFFAQPTPVPAPVIQPPQSMRGALTREDVGRMSPEEINRNWAAVRSVLARN